MSALAMKPPPAALALLAVAAVYYFTRQRSNATGALSAANPATVRQPGGLLHRRGERHVRRQHPARLRGRDLTARRVHGQPQVLRRRQGDQPQRRDAGDQHDDRRDGS